SMHIVDQTAERLVLNGGRVWLVAGSAVLLGVIGITLLVIPPRSLPLALTILLGLGLLVIASGLMLSVKTVTCTFDKRRNTLETLYEGLMTAERQHYDLRDIQTITVRAAEANPKAYRLL